jgi:hydroxymethylglutaryl-CoA lyase
MSSDFVFVNDVGPRDGLQNQQVHVSSDDRIRLIGALIDAGVPDIEVASFVSPKAVPQMAGAGEIVRHFEHASANISSLVPNQKGYELAKAAGAKIISVVPSATETMNQKNINMSLEQTVRVSCEILQQAKADGLTPQAYVAVAVECPYEGKVATAQVMDVAQKLWDAGAEKLILADTIGAANPQQIRSLFKAANSLFPSEKLAVHLHDTRAMALANTFAALEENIRHFDASIGGLGGCPFAPGAAGNLATEDLVGMLHQMGLQTGIQLDALLKVSDLAGDLVQKGIGGRMKTWLLKNSGSVLAAR